MSACRASVFWDDIFNAIKDIKNFASGSDDSAEKIVIGFLEQRNILESIDWMIFSHKSVITKNTKYLFWRKVKKDEIIADLFKSIYNKSTQKVTFNQIYDILEKNTNEKDNKKIAKVSINTENESSDLKIKNNGVFLEFILPKICGPNNNIKRKTNNNNSTSDFYRYTNDQASHEVQCIQTRLEEVISSYSTKIKLQCIPTSLCDELGLTVTEELLQYLYLPFIIDTSTEKCFYFFPPLVIRDSNLLTVSFFSKEIDFKILDIFQIFISYISALFKSIEFSHLYDIQVLKTAIISILVDSFAHNISAHSLSALKWFFEKRASEYNKQIDVSNITSPLRNLEPTQIEVECLKNYAQKSFTYYKLLGLDDSSNSYNSTSLMEIIMLLDENREKSLLTYQGNYSNDRNDKYGYPVPIDFAIWKFIRFLRDKAAFWSGVTRDQAFGGETKNLYEVLWNDFADNPLYLGTIAHSEGINKLRISVELPNDYPKKEFAIIDMSIMNENNSNPEPVTYNIENKEEKVSYSKYALVYPGKDHKEIREELQKSSYNLFFPGGVVGKHALFTIFENTIRNIKHFEVDDTMKTDGLNFNVRISPAKLMCSTIPRIGDTDHKLFKIGVYLDHGRDQSKIDTILETLQNQTCEPIINTNGSPRLGGNAQDKICAAMLINNRFVSVVPDPQHDTDKYYHDDAKKLYWIGFEKEDSNTNILKYFHIWKGDYIYTCSSVDDLKNENVSRFKFIYLNSETDWPLSLALRSQGVIRILTESDIRAIEVEYMSRRNQINALCNDWAKKVINNSSKDINALIEKIKKTDELHDLEKYYIYMAWLKKFIDKEDISFLKCAPSPQVTVSIHDYKFIEDGINSTCCKKIYFRHSGETHGIPEEEILNFRSHGWMREKIFKNDDLGFHNTDDNQDLIKNHFTAEEFIEVLSTKVCIIDNRVNDRIHPNNKDKYKKLLNLEVYREFDININADKAEWYEIKKNIKKYNFLIIHLTYIESLGFKEVQINKFFENELRFKGENIPEKFYVIITSGRGRSQWTEFIKEEYKKITMFKPIESILDAVEQGVDLKDDIHLKYNLSKIIYGS